MEGVRLHFYKGIFFSLFAAFVFFLTCLIVIRTMPGDWYGDISVEHEFVMRILQGQGVWTYDLSAGPLMHYLITPFIALRGATYESYMIASALVGAATIPAIAFFGASLFGWEVGIWSSLFAASSFWLLVWSSLGSSPQVLSPLIVSLALGSTLYGLLLQSRLFLLIGGFVSTLGLSSYPGLFPLPVAAFSFLFWHIWIKKHMNFHMSVPFFLGSVVGLVLFGIALYNNPVEFTTGYIGQKRPEILSPQSINTYIGNVLINLRSLASYGDRNFRVNIPGRGLIEVIPFLLSIVGIVFLVRSRRICTAIGFFLLLLLFVTPGSLPSIPVEEIPNSGRIFAVFPLLMVLAGYGAARVRGALSSAYRVFGWVALGVGVCITYSNSVQAYTRSYRISVPDRMIPMARPLADAINQLPDDTIIHMTSCCWGANYQPEPKAIFYQLRSQKNREGMIHESFLTTCDGLSDKDVVISAPTWEKSIYCPQKTCFIISHKDIPIGKLCR